MQVPACSRRDNAHARARIRPRERGTAMRELDNLYAQRTEHFRVRIENS